LKNERLINNQKTFVAETSSKDGARQDKEKCCENMAFQIGRAGVGERGERNVGGEE